MYVHNFTMVIIVVWSCRTQMAVRSPVTGELIPIICICTFAYAVYDTSSWAAPSYWWDYFKSHHQVLVVT